MKDKLKKIKNSLEILFFILFIIGLGFSITVFAPTGIIYFATFLFIYGHISLIANLITYEKRKKSKRESIWLRNFMILFYVLVYVIISVIKDFNFIYIRSGTLFFVSKILFGSVVLLTGLSGIKTNSIFIRGFHLSGKNVKGFSTFNIVVSLLIFIWPWK